MEKLKLNVGTSYYEILCLLISAFLISGCAKYSKVVQLTPQNASGWKLSNEMSVNKCNDVDVWVRPLVMSYKGGGTEVLFIPIPTSDKKSLGDANEINPSIEITFKHWYRDEHIESCALSFLEVESLDFNKRIQPISVQKFTGGEHVNKFSTICTYFFNPNDISGTKFNIHVKEEALGCRFEPIPSIYENKTHHTIYDYL